MHRVLDIKASKEEIDQIIQELCKRFDFTYDKTKSLVKSGKFLGLHPENAFIKIKISYDNNSLKLEPVFYSTFLTRKKLSRIAEERLGLVEDYIKHRLGGNSPEKFIYTGYESEFTHPISYTWSIFSFSSCLAFSILILIPFCASVIEFGEIALRSKTLQAINKIALPNGSELQKVDTIFKLGSGLLLAATIAFFIAFIYSLSATLGQFSKRFGNVNFTVLIFIGIFIFVSFVTVLPIYSAFVAAILVPTSTHVGYTIVWGRKKEKKPIERKREIHLAIAFVALLLVACIPLQTNPDAMLSDVASTRDALLNIPICKGFCDFYYTHTPYVSSIFKELYTDDRNLRKQQVTCFLLVDKGEDIKSRLEVLDIYVDYAYEEGSLEKIREKEYDFYMIDKKFSNAILFLNEHNRTSRTIIINQKPATPEWIKSELKRVSTKHFKTRFLRELAATGWLSLYYFNRLCIVLVLFGILFILMKIFKITAKLTWAISICSLLTLVASNFIEKPYSVSKPDINNLDTSSLKNIISHVSRKTIVEWDHETKEKLKAKISKISIEGNLTERMYSCELMGFMRDKAFYSYLLRAMSDKEIYVKYKAVEALSRLGVQESAAQIKTFIEKESWYVGGYALQALRDLVPYRY